MARKDSLRLSCCLVAALLVASVIPASAEDRWINTTSGTFSWTDGTKWSSAAAPGNEDVRITNNVAGSFVITNAGQGSATINFLAISNSTVGTTTVIQQSNTFWTSSFGLQLGTNGILILTTNAQFGVGNNGDNNTFDLAAGGQKGTLILSNAANDTSFTLFVIKGNSANNVTNAMVNGGTIQFVSGANQSAGLNYGQTLGFTNLSTGTIVSRGSGTNNFTGVFGGSNRGFINNGTILMQNTSTLIIRPEDAFSLGGFSNSSTGFIQINAGTTFGIDRTTNAWVNSGNDPVSVGEIQMVGGTMTMYDSGNLPTQNVTRTFRNAGVIDGNGTLAFQMRNVGSVVASNGTLNVSNVVGNAGIWVAKNNGTLLFIGNADLGAGSMTNTGNTIQIGRAATLPNTVTMSTSYLNNDGTLLLGNTGGGGSTLTLANTGAGGSTDGVQFTNAVTGVMAGRGTLNFGFGAGQANAGFVNNGSILAGQGNAGSLTLDVSDSLNKPFSNSSTGYIIISNKTHFGVSRTATQWNAGTLDSQRVMNAGTIILNDGTFVSKASGAADADRLVINGGTIIAQGQSSTLATNAWRAAMENRGTILITNDTSVFQMSFTTKQLTNTATGNIILGGNGAVGSFTGTNMGRLVNLGTIQGQGTITLGLDANGQNASLPNSGQIIATNFGANAQGTLTLNTGNAFSNGGLLNNGAGVITVGTNMTFVLNRTANAWNSTVASAVNVFSNQGTVYLQGGTFMTSADGVVDTTPTRTNLNTGLITGWGTFGMLITNETGGQVLADARGLTNRNTGTLTVSLISPTNNNGATIGAIGTNSVLLVAINNSALINNGTIQLSAGSIVLSNTLTGTTGGTITNFNAIAGVGVVSNFPIVQAGANASLIAKTPTDGQTALIATVSPTNSSLLAAITNAELRLTVSGGGNSMINQGRMQIDGGSITIGGASGIISNDVNGLFFGQGTNNNVIVTSAITSKIQASNGLLVVGLANNSNTGSLEAFSGTDTLRLTNSFLANAGTMKANAGTVDVVAGGIITNSGTIVGAGVYDSSIVNASGGQITANSQTQTLGSATATFLNQAGGTIRVTAGTLNVDVGSWNNAGSITNAAGAVLTRTTAVGVMTNSGVIVNLGSIGAQVVNNANITNTGGTFVLSVTNNAGAFILSSQGSFTGATFANLGGTFKGTNTSGGVVATNYINSTTAINTGTLISGSGGGILLITNLLQNFVNQGTMLLDSPSTSTNLAFDIRRTGGSGDFTNDVGGLIQGAGFLKTGDFIPGGQNFSQWNKGSIIATNGALIIQPADAFGNGGFVNMAGATVTVASASTFGIQRSDNAWGTSGTVPRNEGTIQINGGTLAFYGNGLNLANDRSLSNAATGRLLGNGTIEAGIVNFGTINLNNTGTLYVDNSKTAAGANVWGIQNGGTIVINTNNTLVLNRLAADWAANEGLNDSGTIRFNGGVYQSAVAGAINNQSTNFISAAGTGGIYGNGTFDSALDAQSGTLSAENGTLTFTRSVINNVGNGVTAQALGAGNVLQFFGGASFSASSAVKANSGGEVRFVGTTNAVIAGAFDNTGGFLTVTGASTVFLTNNFARANLGTITLGGAGNINYGGVGDLFTNGSVATIRSIGPNGGTITGVLGANNFGFINRGTLTVGSGSTLTLDPRDAFIVGFSNASTGRIILENTDSSLAITRTTGAWTGGDTIKNEGTIIMNGGTVATFDTGGTSPNTARLIQNDGTVQVLGAAGVTVTFQASVANAGRFDVSSGLFTMVNPLGSTFTNLAGGFFRAGSETTRFSPTGAAGTSSNNVFNAGTFSWDNGTIGAGNFANAGTFIGNLGGTGTGTITINGVGNVFSNAAGGTIVVANTGTNLVNGTVVNLGVIQATANGAFGASGGNFTNAAGGLIISTNAAVTLAIQNTAGRFLNLGTMVVSNGGTISMANSSSTGLDWTNKGTVVIGDANSVGFLNTGTFTSSGTITGRGTITLGVGAGSTGRQMINSGTLNVLNNGLLVISNFAGASAASPVQFNNSGTVNVGNAASELRLISAISDGAGGTLGLTNLNSGTVQLNGGTLSYVSGTRSVLSNVAGGLVSGSGLITNAFLVNNGAVMATNGELALKAIVSGAGDYKAVAGASSSTLTFMDGGSISSLINTGATIRVVGALTNANAFINAGSLVMAGGAYQSSATVTNTSGSWLTGVGTVAATTLNSGTIFANSSTPLTFSGPSLNNLVGGVVTASAASLVVNGTFQNAGTFAAVSSVGTFNGTVVNSGAWITDPTTNVFQNTYTVTSSGYIQTASGDVYVFTNGATTAADFVNLSSKSNQFDTLNGKFLFNNTLGLTQNLVVAGHDLGPGVGAVPPPNATNAVQFGLPDAPIFGFTNNFALGTLEISDFTTVRVTDAFLALPGLGTNDGLTAGLYLNNLLMGLDSLLIISSNVQVYFKSSNTWDTSNFVLEGNPTYDNAFNGLHQLVVVPEPGVLFLWLCGVGTVYAARRRSRKMNRG